MSKTLDNSILSTARDYVDAGLSVIPIRCDGSKAPELDAWKPYQERIAGDDELTDWFDNGKQVGVAGVGGKVSGGLEDLDFDDPSLLDPWADKCIKAGLSNDLLLKLVVVKTPGGWHVYYRCPDAIESSQKLARRQGADGKVQTLIETKAEGGYFIMPGSPPGCHPENKTYQLTRGNFDNIPVITAEERQIMLDVASSFNEYFKEVFTRSEPQTAQTANNNELQPGDDFNIKADWWRDILSPAGCRKIYTKGEESYLVKPGSKSKAPHATLNWKGIDKLYVFSSSFPGLDAERSYDKFGAYTYLFHDGNFTESTKALAAKGYGIPAKDSSKKSAEGTNQAVKQRSPIVEVVQASDLIVPAWPILKQAALPGTEKEPGLIREFVEKVTEFSEADPAAVLFTFLTKCGATIGDGTYFRVNSTKHPARLNVLVVGATSRGRKGTGAAPVIELAKSLLYNLPIRVAPGPLSSGEGLIYAVRDPGEELKDDGSPKDPGVADKRLLVIDEELRRALASFKREGNTLATTIRAAYDRGDLDPLTKNNRIKATGAHICIVAHISAEELAKHFDEIEIFSGTMNRFFLVCSRRSKVVSRPKPLDEKWLQEFALRLSNRIVQIRKLGAVEFDDEAWADWDEIYPELTQDQPGLLGAVTGRAEAQTIRAALAYALLDESITPGTQMISDGSLRAALAALDYSKDSAKYLYGNPNTDPEHDTICARILEALKAAPEGLSSTDIHVNVFKSNVHKNIIHPALGRLQSSGRISQTTSEGGPGIGRAKTTWFLTKGFEK